MENNPDNTPEPVLLLIADISGYTRYMTANAKTFAHSQTVITELVKAIIEQVEVPLEVAKLEGDAIFLFCRPPPDALQWMAARAEISRKLLDFFRLFREKITELSGSTTCDCHACTHIEKLRLKIIVHRGEALFHRVLHFDELAGVDVIIAHRLLKNSIKAGQYLLLTEAAMQELQFPPAMVFQSASESYEDIGRIKTAFHDFDLAAAKEKTGGRKSFGTRYHESLRLFLNLWFGPLARGRGNFRNLPDGPGRSAKEDLPC